jgi:DNA polymerase III subunit gamma/tau
MAKAKSAPKVVEKAPEAPVAVAPMGATYTVVARRYRPQQFSDLIGQEHVAQALTNAIKSGRIAHAFLFTGARGVGKTSSARILAKALNCTSGPTVTPCDECDSCRGIIAGSDVDVSEIDGASNNKVEEIRDLKSNINFRPQHSRFKIYIIDEVHMLSNSAFNALLKTLEEPPEHVKFIFATTEVQKIPITILSRCQRFDFAAIGPSKVFETLKHIVKKEGLEAEEDALHTVARRANGSMRDAQTLLDQLLSFTEGKLTAAKLHDLLGSAGDERILTLADAILSKDAATALRQVSEAAEAGLQLGEFVDQLIDHWRGFMLLHVVGPGAKDLPGSPSLHVKLKEQAQRITLDTVLAGLDILTTTKSKARMTAHLQVLVEMAVVRLCRLEELLTVSSLVQLAQTGGSLPKPVAPRPESADPSKKNEPLIRTHDANPGQTSISGRLPEGWLVELWPKVILELGMFRGKQLQDIGLPAILGPNSLLIRIPSSYNSLYEGLKAEGQLDILRKAIQRETGEDVQIQLELDRTAPVTNAPQKLERTEDVLKLPMFQKAVQSLKAQLLRVEEGFNPFSVSPTTTTLTDDSDEDEPLPTTVDPEED